MSEEIKKEQETTEKAVSAAEKEKPVTDNDEIKAFHKEVLGKPDSPLVVHKKDDASYEDDGAAFDMEMTHNEETKPTLERHRYKKDPSEKHNGLKVLLALLVIAACVFAALYFTGRLPFQKETTTVAEETVAEETTSLEEKYQGTIVVKDTYVFVDGSEVNGIEGLQSALKYKDAGTSAYMIINEHADADFLNYNVYPLLTDLGFFGDDTVVEVREKTGLMAQAELDEEAAAQAAAEAATATTEAVTEAPAETAAEETTAA
ncbi:MAG: hypothetical protein IJ168_07490 [Eubacterium sp.]|nr:hypothetical protein [Eubacterium sp.]